MWPLLYMLVVFVSYFFCKSFGVSTYQFLTEYYFVSLYNFHVSRAISFSYKKKYSFHNMKLIKQF